MSRSASAVEIENPVVCLALKTGWVGTHIGQPENLTPEEILAHTAKIIANETLTASERVKLISKLQEQAFKDDLTGLFNRRSYDEDLGMALKNATLSKRQSDNTYVLMIDGDNFKSINTKCGYEGGDKAIQLIAETLQKSVRDGDNIYRRGGDEFCIILKGINQKGVESVIKNIEENFSNTNLLHGNMTVPVRVSVGAAKIDKNSTFSSVEETAEAKLKLYKAETKRGRPLVSVPSM